MDSLSPAQLQPAQPQPEIPVSPSKEPLVSSSVSIKKRDVLNAHIFTLISATSEEVEKALSQARSGSIQEFFLQQFLDAGLPRTVERGHMKDRFLESGKPLNSFNFRSVWKSKPFSDLRVNENLASPSFTHRDEWTLGSNALYLASPRKWSRHSNGQIFSDQWGELVQGYEDNDGDNEFASQKELHTKVLKLCKSSNISPLEKYVLESILNEFLGIKITDITQAINILEDEIILAINSLNEKLKPLDAKIFVRNGIAFIGSSNQSVQIILENSETTNNLFNQNQKVTAISEVYKRQVKSVLDVAEVAQLKMQLEVAEEDKKNAVVRALNATVEAVRLKEMVAALEEQNRELMLRLHIVGREFEEQKRDDSESVALLNDSPLESQVESILSARLTKRELAIIMFLAKKADEDESYYTIETIKELGNFQFNSKYFGYLLTKCAVILGDHQITFEKKQVKGITRYRIKRKLASSSPSLVTDYLKNPRIQSQPVSMVVIKNKARFLHQVLPTGKVAIFLAVCCDAEGGAFKNVNEIAQSIGEGFNEVKRAITHLQNSETLARLGLKLEVRGNEYRIEKLKQESDSDSQETVTEGGALSKTMLEIKHLYSLARETKLSQKSVEHVMGWVLELGELSTMENAQEVIKRIFNEKSKNCDYGEYYFRLLRVIKLAFLKLCVTKGVNVNLQEQICKFVKRIDFALRQRNSHGHIPHEHMVIIKRGLLEGVMEEHEPASDTVSDI